VRKVRKVHIQTLHPLRLPPYGGGEGASLFWAFKKPRFND
jgi:hypothetical protein